MRFWLSRDNSIPIREQLAAQLILGILSRRFAPGDKLPSVRELARRLKIHSNTVSATYQDLATRGWVTRRAGAGVFVTVRSAPRMDDSVDAFAQRFVAEGLAHGYSQAEMKAAFLGACEDAQPTDMVVVDPDFEMARILAAEIGEATGRPVRSMDLTEAAKGVAPGTCVLGNEAYTAKIETVLKGQRPFRAIQLKSMQEVVAGQKRPDRPVLIGVASHSESILRWSGTLLSALGFPPDSVIQRNVALPGWKEGLLACDIVAVDVLTAAEAPSALPIVVFRTVSDDFLASLRDLVTDHEV